MGYVTNRPQDSGKECCMNQRYSCAGGFKQQVHVETHSRWSMMTSKIPMKVVLPFLVIIIVIISLMQFGRPHVILLLQANRSTELPVTLSPPVLVDSNGVAAGVILSLQQQSKNEPDQAKFPATNTKSKKKPTISHASSHQHIHTDAKTMDRVHICQAQNKAVFIKTHKTASTTAASIFERYGYSHNLMFALPWITHIFDENKLFNRDMVMTFRGMTTFDMITNHGRFNRKRNGSCCTACKVCDDYSGSRWAI
ncbi:uncharacterized protein [Amphiura filiformis]|uniref:uncharacterized protein isoform X2 n=1 Tax=Amphiura filiformis TaxID=82378 RepID=UPI003B21A0F9